MKRAFMALSLSGAITALATGVASYGRGIPESTLPISASLDQPQIRSAMIQGVFHLVYCEPMDKPMTADTKVSLAGFSVKEITFGNTYARGIGLPFWSLTALLSIYPLVWFVRGPLRRRRRLRCNQCTSCGYRLTGNISGICPECGSWTSTGSRPSK